MIIELTPDEVEEVRYRIGSGSMREGLCCAIRLTVEVPLSPDRLIARPQ
ncbi:hypothetical protein PAYE108092_20405 [Paracoccus yeei]